MATSRRVVPLASGSVVAVIALLGASLLLTAWTTRRAVRDASATLLRGRADGFEQAVRAHLADLGEPPTSADLAALLDEESPAGLRWLGIVDPRGEVFAEAGNALGGPATRPAHDGPGDTLEVIGPRVRVAFHVIARRGRRVPEALRGRAALIVFEFEPVQADALRRAADRTLAIGGIAATALVFIALALVWWVVTRERLARDRERDRRLASLGEMSAVLAHEIRNPLASLKGNAQLLAGGLPEGEKPRQKADRVVEEAIRLEQLTNDLLEFVRTGELHRAPADPAALLVEAAASVDAAITVDATFAPATWSFDRERVREVLTNLLANAVQAGAPVRASVTVDKGALQIDVRDGGPGVAAEDVARIFEPFFTKRTRGTGLGLAVAKRIVELHGGTISVENARGGGAQFRVRLPSA